MTDLTRTLLPDPLLPDWVQDQLNRVPQVATRDAMPAHLKALGARYDTGHKRVVVDLANGASFAFPPALAQGLAGAAASELAVIEVSPMGTSLHWPRLNVDLAVEGLLAGLFGSPAWMRQHAAQAGRATSAAKARAARANGAKGGRPRKAAV